MITIENPALLKRVNDSFFLMITSTYLSKKIFGFFSKIQSFAIS